MDFTKFEIQTTDGIDTKTNVPDFSVFEVSDLALALVGGGIGDVVPA